MYLILKINGPIKSVWPLTWPMTKNFPTPEEKFKARQAYLNIQLELAKREAATLIDKATDWEFYVEVKARLQPKDFEKAELDYWHLKKDFAAKAPDKFKRIIREPPDTPVVKLVRPDAKYSNVRSLY